MSFIDLFLRRRPQFFGTSVSSRHAVTCQPRVEVLEERQCLSVSAPTGLQLTALSATQVKLRWNDVAGEFGYRVFRLDGTTTVLVSQLAKNVTTFTVKNLQPNQTQWFAVEAFDNATTARGAWAAVNTPPNAITAPTHLRVASTTQTQVTLTWRFATGTRGYRIYGWDGARAVLLGSVGATSNAYTARNLTPGSSYYFYVQSFNPTNTASTDWVTASTTATSITAPANIKAVAVNASTIALSWTDSTGETGYRVYRWDGNSLSAPALVATLAANVTGYQAVGLVPGKTYWFYVQAFNATHSANSVWAQATTTVAVPLQPPTQVFAIANGTSSVKISWVEPARAVGYRVFVWAGTYWSSVVTVAAGTHQTVITGLATNRTQWFTVQAFTDNFAEVSYSSAVFVNL